MVLQIFPRGFHSAQCSKSLHLLEIQEAILKKLMNALKVAIWGSRAGGRKIMKNKIVFICARKLHLSIGSEIAGL